MDADDIVLVALMNNPRDMDMIRAEHWYRIPAKHAPVHLSRTRYLAFYLTKAFPEDKWTIREYALMRGHELVRRRDLFPDESEHTRADEAYYKLQLGPLISLSHPIVSRSGRRILFIWTTGDKFSRAVEINDLLGRSGADDLLWDAMKSERIHAERQMTVHDAHARYRIDFWIPCVRGALAVILSDTPRRLPKGKGWRGLHLSESDALAGKRDCISKIRHLVRELGGLKYPSETK